MPKQSAGILLYRINKGVLQFFLVHPGGPFFKNKDEGGWSIPKGEFINDEEALPAAIREFKEETGFDVDGHFLMLKPVKLKSGKKVYAWGLEGDIDIAKIASNTFEIEWPPRSGKMKAFPEIDKGQWFTSAEAKLKLNPAQAPFIDELQHLVSASF